MLEYVAATAGVVVGIVVAAVLALYLHGKYIRFVHPGPRIPSLSNAHPLFGNVPGFMRNMYRVHDYVADELKALGGTGFSYVPFAFQGVYITDAASVEHVLKGNFDNYVKDPLQQDLFQELLGRGIFNTDGDNWNAQRKTASHIFRVRNFRDHMTRVFQNHAAVLLHLLDGGASRDMQDVYARFTLDSIGQIAFGIDIKSLEHGTAAFARAFDRVQDVASKRFFDPLWKLKRAVTRIIPGANSREQLLIDSVKEVNEFAYKVIRERRARPDHDEEDGDLLSMFMQEKDDAGVGYDDLYLRDMILDFMIAGRDTTASTLSWVSYLLATHPEVCAKMVAELDEVLGGTAPTYEKMGELKYLQAVIDETIRIYPPVPVDLKCAVGPDVLPNGFHVRAGQNVVYHIYTMGHDEKRWPEPTRFIPERWLERQASRMTQFEFPVFNGGPRLCLGQSMAYLEAKMVLAHIYQKYTLELLPGQDVTYTFTITLAMANPLMMKAVPR